MNLALVLFFAGAALFWGVIKQHRRIRQIEDTASSKTSTAAQGLVELQGFAWPAGPTYKLKNQQEVVYYSCEIQYSRSGFYFYFLSSQFRWKTVAKRVHAIPFYLIDDEGIVKVNPTGAELYLNSNVKKTWKDLSELEKQDFLSKDFKPPIPLLSRIMGGYRSFYTSSIKIPVTFFFSFFFYLYDKSLFFLIPHYPPRPKDKNYRILESWIEVGSPLYVSGSFQTSRKENSSLQQKGLSTFTKNILSSSFEVLSESAKIMDLEEFKKDYITFAQQARAEAVSEPELTYPVHGSIQQNMNHKIFIGDGFESHLKEKLRAWLPARFIGGAAVMALAVTLSVSDFQSRMRKISLAKQQQQARTISQIPPASELHQKCVDGSITDCQTLMQNHQVYQLPEVNLNYYKQRLNQLQQ